MKKLLFLGLLLSLPTFGAVNPICNKAKVNSLVITHPMRYPHGLDVCSLIDINTPLEMREALMDILDIHQKAASVLGLSLEKILSRGIDVTVRASAQGLNGTARTQDHSINLTTIPNPARWINRGVYAHEFGHTLSFPDTLGTAPLLKSIGRSSLFSETYADTVALALVGTDTSPERSLPGCMSEPRVGLAQSYLTPFGEFDAFSSLHRLKKCCEAHENFLPDMRDLCSKLFLGADGEPNFLPAFDLEPFSVKRMSAKSIDTHRIGIPLNSFLKDLGLRLNKNYFAELLKSLTSPKGKDFRCELAAVQTITVKAFVLKDQLQSLAKDLSTSDKAVFDTLWKTHTMDIAVALDEKDQAERSQTLARTEFIKLLTTSDDGKAQACRKAFINGDSNGTVAGCNIKCR